MANSIITVPNLLDTAGTVIATASKYTVVDMLWVPVADGDSISLTRADDTVYFTLTAVLATVPIPIPGIKHFDDGLKVVGANPGELYLWKA